MKKLRRDHRSCKQKLRDRRLRAKLSSLITNTLLRHKDLVISRIMRDNELAKRLIQRFEAEDQVEGGIVNNE